MLDTSVLLAAELAPIEGELAVSAISLAELHYGVMVAASDEIRARRLRVVARVERAFAPLPVDEDVAREYGVIAAAVRRAGRHPRGRTLDLLIAATAAAHGARLVTRDARDFVGLADFVEVLVVA